MSWKQVIERLQNADSDKFVEWAQACEKPFYGELEIAELFDGLTLHTTYYSEQTQFNWALDVYWKVISHGVDKFFTTVGSLPVANMPKRGVLDGRSLIHKRELNINGVIAHAPDVSHFIINASDLAQFMSIGIACGYIGYRSTAQNGTRQLWGLLNPTDLKLVFEMVL